MAACTFTTTMPDSPAFRVGIDTVGNHLDSIVSAQHFNLDGVKKSVNGTATRTMEITVTNGKNLPSEGPALHDLGKALAVYVKGQLKDSTSYDLYEVRFETVASSGGMTTNNFTTIEFKTNELPPAD
jgi:hypothetical protein